MKVLNLLEELEELIDNAKTVPLTGMTVVNKDELFDFIKDIRIALPDEVEQARMIVNERETIIKEAKIEYDKKIEDAKEEREKIIDEHEITTRAANKATEMLNKTERHIINTKKNAYDFLDKTLYDFQDKLSDIYSNEFKAIYSKVDVTFNTMAEKIIKNREEIRDLSAKLDK